VDPTEYLMLFAILVGVNLLPAFGPPTWSIIVLYGLNSDLPTVGIILVAAVAAAVGRFMLAMGFRMLGGRIPRSARENLAAARALFERNPRNAHLAMALFILSPLPSAQLFEAAGLARVRLGRFTLAFFSGRLVSYAIYASSVRELKESQLGQYVVHGLSGPMAIVLQLAMIGGLIALARIDWRKLLDRQQANEAEQSGREDNA
jgi:uncharacterized membrane protein YdjX (TVP38/TMEM64 family)